MRALAMLTLATLFVSMFAKAEVGKKMAKNIDIVDIAEYAGVSISTVSRVLNNHPDVSAKTRAHVQKVIDKYDYVPNNSARNLKRESARAIGIIVKGFTNPFFIAMISDMRERLEEEGYEMVLHQIDTQSDEVVEAISLCKEKKLRGLIFMGGNFMHNQETISMLEVPFVMLTMTIHDNVDREAFSSVTIDDYKETRKAMTYICDAGHRDIAAICGAEDDVSISALREDAIKDELSERGLSVAGRIGYAGDFSRESGYKTAKKLLETSKFTCLFCISDLLAIGAIRAIHDHGLRVPEDISVFGFDGIEEGKYSIPSLTTIEQPSREMAVESVKLLLAHLRRKKPHKHEVFRAELVEGESFRSYCKD